MLENSQDNKETLRKLELNNAKPQHKQLSTTKHILKDRINEDNDNNVWLLTV